MFFVSLFSSFVIVQLLLEISIRKPASQTEIVRFKRTGNLEMRGRGSNKRHFTVALWEM